MNITVGILACVFPVRLRPENAWLAANGVLAEEIGLRNVRGTLQQTPRVRDLQSEQFPKVRDISRCLERQRRLADGLTQRGSS